MISREMKEKLNEKLKMLINTKNSKKENDK